jgi:hypothetical protein
MAVFVNHHGTIHTHTHTHTHTHSSSLNTDTSKTRRKPKYNSCRREVWPPPYNRQTIHQFDKRHVCVMHSDIIAETRIIHDQCSFYGPLLPVMVQRSESHAAYMYSIPLQWLRIPVIVVCNALNVTYLVAFEFG